MNYWVVRKFKSGEAISVFEMEEIPTGVEEAPNGVWTQRVDFQPTENNYIMSQRENELDSDGKVKWKPVGLIEPITKVEYQTYKEFGCFDEETS